MNTHNPEQIDSGEGLNQPYKLCTDRVDFDGKLVVNAMRVQFTFSHKTASQFKGKYLCGASWKILCSTG